MRAPGRGEVAERHVRQRRLADARRAAEQDERARARGRRRGPGRARRCRSQARRALGADLAQRAPAAPTGPGGARGRARAARAAARSSTSVFHSPHDGHWPCHFGRLRAAGGAGEHGGRLGHLRSLGRGAGRIRPGLLAARVAVRLRSWRCAALTASPRGKGGGGGSRRASSSSGAREFGVRSARVSQQSSKGRAPRGERRGARVRATQSQDSRAATPRAADCRPATAPSLDAAVSAAQHRTTRAETDRPRSLAPLQELLHDRQEALGLLDVRHVARVLEEHPLAVAQALVHRRHRRAGGPRRARRRRAARAPRSRRRRSVMSKSLIVPTTVNSVGPFMVP